MADHDILDRVLSRRAPSPADGRASLQALDESLNRRRQRLAEASQQKRERLAQYQESAIGKVGLDPDSAAGKAANTYASLVSGGARTVGDLISAPLDAFGVSQERGITDAQRDAYARLQQDRPREAERQELEAQVERGIPLGDPQRARLDELRAYQPQASEDDRALLNQRAEQAAQANLNLPEVYGDNVTTSETALERLDRAQKARDTAQTVDDATDFSNRVYQGSRQDLSEDLARGGREGLDRLKQARQSLEDKEFDAALTDGIAGVVDLAMNAGSAVMDNPQAVAEYAAENIPQLVMGANNRALLTAANIGYGLDNYREGIRKFQAENDGRQPSEDQREWMLVNAIGAAAADQLGDAALIGKALPGKADPLRQGLVQSLKRAAGGTASGTATEGVTEGVQTVMEAEARGETASAQEIYEGATIGAAVGGAISGAGSTAQEARTQAQRASAGLGRSLEEADKDVARDDAFEAAAESGDVSAYTDAEATTYAPERAVQALAKRNQREDVAADEKRANLETASEQIAALEERVEDARLEAERLNPDNADTLAAQASTLRERGDEETAAVLESLAEEARATTPEVQRARQRAVKTEQAKLDQAVKLRDRMGQDLAPASDGVESSIELADSAPETEGSTRAADEVITLAMESPDLLDPSRAQALADNTGNALNGGQREYLRRFSAARAAENRLKGLEGVKRDILTGGKDFVGVSQYRSRLKNQLSRGNMQGAQTQLSGLRRFAERHAAKLAAAESAYADFQETGKPVELNYTPDQGWHRIEGPRSRRGREQAGGMSIGAEAPGLLKGIREEVPVLESAVAELQAAYDLRFAAPDDVATTQQDNSATEPQAEATVPVMVTRDMKRRLRDMGHSDAAIKKMKPAEAWQTIEDGEAAAREDVDATEAPVAERDDGGAAQEAGTAPTAEPAEPAPAADAAVAGSAPTVDEALDFDAETGEIQAEQTLPDGRLTRLADAVKDQARVTAESFWQTNLVQRFFTQQGAAHYKTRRKPLASAKDFISALKRDPSLAEQFVTNGTLTENQRALVAYLADVVPSWNATLAELMPAKGDERFAYQDLVQFLRNDDGSVDENLLSALSVSALGWVAETGPGGAFTDDAAINAILGREGDMPVTPEMREALSRAGSRERMVINRLGSQALDALGLSAERDVPANLREQLIGALGSRALGVLLEEGVVERGVFTQQELDALTGEQSDGRFANVKHHFIRVNQDPNDPGRQLADEISHNVQGSGGLLTTLFGAEMGTKAPSFSKAIFKQTQAKNSNRGVPAPLARILEGEGAKQHFVREEMVTLWRALDENTRLTLAGGVDPTQRWVHAAKGRSVDGKNEALLREAQRFDSFLESLEGQETGLATPFFFDRSVWKMQRVGLDATLVNPQASKMQRHLIKMGGWDNAVRLDNQDGSLDAFLLAVGESLGVKTDAKPSEEALQETRAKLADPVIEAGVVATVHALNNAPLSAADQQAIAAAVAQGDEGYHSLDGLVGLAQRRMAERAGQDSFTTALTREVDGKTNGPMLAMGQVAAADSAEGLLDRWEMGGFFSQASGHTQVNEWARQGGTDLYQRTAVSIYERIQGMLADDPEMAKTFEALYAFTGTLYDPQTDKVTGRNLVKTPVTALVFGSAGDSVVESMAGNFIDAVYDKLEAVANDPATDLAGKDEATRDLLLRLNHLMGREALNVDMGISQAMQTSLTKGQEKALKARFSASLGAAVKEAMEQDFGTFIERRKVLNQSANAAYRLYRAAYEHERAKLLEQAVADGSLPTSGKDAIPLFDLTAEQDQAIRDKLKPLEPVIHSAFSKVEGNLDNGIFLAKTARQLSDEKAYAQTTKFSRKVDGNASLSSRGNRLVYEDPGVAAVIMAIHSSDSYIAANTYGRHQGLNVHDAIISSLQDTPAVARDLNRYTLEVLTDYSVPSEIADALARTAAGFKAYVAAENGGKLDPALLEQLGALVVDNPKATRKQKLAAGRKQLEQLKELLPEVRSTANRADRVKLAALDQLVAVDQYSLEGGNYVLTAEDHIKIQAKLAELAPAKPGAAPQAAPSPSAWGTLGHPTSGSDPALVQAFQNGEIANAGQAKAVLKRKLAGMPAGRTRDFYRELLGELSRQVPDGLPIHYVTATTPNGQAPEGLSPRARGAYHVDADGNAAIYVKSPDFRDSAVTVELLVHELTHAAVAKRIAAAQGVKARNPASQSEPVQILDELERLRDKARKIVGTDPALQQEFGAAVGDVQELVAWGMTNPRFQREVLNKVRIESKTRRSGLVSGMKALIDNLVGILFKGSEQSKRDRRYNGMAVLVANVSGLMGETQAETQGEAVTLNQEAPGPLQWTTRQVFEALAGPKDSDPRTQAHLRGLLDRLVERLHGPFGAFHEQARVREAATPEETFIKAVQTGQAPFVSETLAAGFQVSEQQAFVLEQVEATVAAGLDSDPTAYRELSKLYREAREALKGQLPQDQYDYLFTLEAGDRAGKSRHLSRFAAVALTYPPLHGRLGFATMKTERDFTDMPLGQKILSLFQRLVNLLHGRLTKTYEGQPADAKLTALVDQLVDVEARHRAGLANRKVAITDRLEGQLGELNQKLMDRVEKAGRSKAFRRRKNGYVRAAGSLVSTVAGDRVGDLLDHLQQLRDQTQQGRQGVVSAAISEMRGAGVEAVAKATRLLREHAKVNEHARLHLIDTTKQNVLESFRDGKAMSRETKEALTRVLLRTDLAALPEDHDLVDLVTRDASRQAAITAVEARLKDVAGEQLAYYQEQARALGFHMATGKATVENLMLNAHNIARAPGVSEDAALAAQEILDPLISLYALDYSDSGQRQRAGEVMKTEMARSDGGNGVEMALKLYRGLQQEALERNFEGNPIHMQKGYTSQIYNPHKSVTVAPLAEAERLKKMGYQQVGEVPRDPADPDRTRKALFVIRDGGLQRYQTGILSYTGEGTRGSTLHKGVTTAGADGLNLHRMELNQKVHQGQRQRAPQANFDPRQASQSFLVPVVNHRGETVNYRYTMQDMTKDRVLERNNSLEDVLGAMAGATFDKQATREQNRVAVEALHAQYQAEYADKPESYLAVGPDVADPEMREMYAMLPDAAKQAIKDVWGGNEMLVRADLADIFFGYRKLSLAGTFAKAPAERDFLEKIVPALTQPFFGDKAALRVRQGEDVWQALAAEVKDILVIKNLTTLVGNVMANGVFLMTEGVGVQDMAKYHREALEGVIHYRRDHVELEKLRQLKAIDYVEGDLAEVNQRIAELEDALARNPTAELIEAGLLPTIVEDVDQHEDPFSYKSKAAGWLDDKTEWMPDGLKRTGRVLYMAHDTPLYKILSQSTQLSDFLARYTLVKHATARAKDPMSTRDAIDLASDMFVYYDAPTHRKLQYLNDMMFLPFTKYYLRIQRMLFRAMREHPARALAMTTLNNTLDGLATPMDAFFTERADNVFSAGAVEYPGVLDELLTVKTAMSPFN